jgi:hypothetical protein
MMLGDIPLDEDLEWTDEYAWSPHEEAVEHSLTGALVVQISPARTAGRPVTLQGATERAWLDQATLDALRATLIQPPPLTLELWDGRTLSVMWRHSETPIDAREHWPGAGYYVATLRLRTIA